jgi:hypothetical protein
MEIKFKDFPNLKSHKNPMKYLRLLAAEIQTYAPVNTKTEVILFKGFPMQVEVNLFRRLKRAYKKYGIAGVTEQFTMIIQNSKKVVPFDSEDGVTEKKVTSSQVIDYFNNLTQLVNNWVLPNR